MRKLIFIILAASQCWGALTFGGATSDRVDCGSATNIDDLAALTVALWVYPTTITDARVIMSKARGSASVGWQFLINGTGGNVRLFWYRATTNLDYVTNTTPLTLNAWNFIALTATQTGPSVNVYKGSLTAGLTAATFGTSTNGTGAFNADNARNLFIGNIDGITPASAFQGGIASAMVLNRVLTQGELQSIQFRTRPLAGSVGYWQLGFNGAGTQPDWAGTGNSCSVTGAASSSNAPLGPVFGFDIRRFLGIDYENHTSRSIFAD